MQEINWRHDGRQLFIPVSVMPSVTASNSTHAVTVRALIDTGATKTGLHPNFIQRLNLAKRDRAPIQTANGTVITELHLARLGFWTAEICQDVFEQSLTNMPFFLDREFLVQALRPDFTHEMLLGMDVIGMCHFTITSDGTAQLRLP